MFYTNHDRMAQVTEEQLMETAEKLFAQIDTNGNNRLEKSEVREFSVQMFQRVKPDGEFDEDKFEENFSTMDKNSDGTISKQELFQSLLQKAGEARVL